MSARASAVTLVETCTIQRPAGIRLQLIQCSFRLLVGVDDDVNVIRTNMHR